MSYNYNFSTNKCMLSLSDTYDKSFKELRVLNAGQLLDACFLHLFNKNDSFFFFQLYSHCF